MAAALLPDIRWQAFDGNGDPLPANPVIYVYASGTSSAQSTFSDSDLTVPNTQPQVADANGRFGPIYLQNTSYKFILADAADEIVWTQDAVGNPGDLFAGNFGTAMTTGTFDVVSGYSVISTDRLVTVDSTGGADPCIINLPAASTRTQSIAIKIWARLRCQSCRTAVTASMRCRRPSRSRPRPPRCSRVCGCSRCRAAGM